MRKHWKVGLAALAAALAVPAAAQQPSVELDAMTVTGERVEMALRAIQVGLDNARSTRAEDRDELVCWFDSKTGSRLQHLFCATNGALNESSDYVQRVLLGMAGGRNGKGRDDIFVSRTPVNRAELKRRLERLGPISVSRELVRRARRSEGVPEDVPGADELERFVQARREIRQGPRRGDERRQALTRAGLSERRYREIQALAAELPSLGAYVNERL